jgi:hypothetical protein
LYRSCTEEEDDRSARQTQSNLAMLDQTELWFPGSRTSLLPLNLQGASEFTLMTGPARDALQICAQYTTVSKLILKGLITVEPQYSAQFATKLLPKHASGFGTDRGGIGPIS